MLHSRNCPSSSRQIRSPCDLSLVVHDEISSVLTRPAGHAQLPITVIVDITEGRRRRVVPVAPPKTAG
ncbi:hypothetical protein SAMN05216203_0695 [Marinobacter daqiaonensis]|uniref:Uncharacterized protein n=1 Tax=Marinobacter daqiaonensis TaxID=650891 RepID=A0A1I6H0S7_9GAMM|nr:hypothetical protein [Marinobacter daqiaonensis]SFR48054.1 hypothetical protein SAMN05216203_0695 [Marinobacter daqiaonensis]